jgi:alkylation response protein AidB-like acyl-CoA dehydrogenase
MSTNVSAKWVRGGEFVIENTEPNLFFCPEMFDEDQKMVINLVRDFIRSTIDPNRERQESLDHDFIRESLQAAGELGILGIPFPENLGGSNMDFVTNILLSELVAEGRSFSLTFGAHTSIGMLPILFFGTEEQQEKYLPPLIQGNQVASYCLTEPGSGSDALAAKTTAELSSDGKYYLMNGQKMWITNGGVADVLIVFAKVDGEKFTGFIVEGGWDGVTRGDEEKKLGIKGSSTCQIFLENVKVPVENVLGEVGKGHKIAFNILNVGRLKLCATAVGSSKLLCTWSTTYARDRFQFGRSISSFGAIQHKLAEQAIRTAAAESALYWVADMIRRREAQLSEGGNSSAEAHLQAAEEYAIECALMKVHGSECLDYVVDEGVQIYGGMGYSEEAPMAGAYRDARINRIFEGTNEINRLLSIDMLLKRALKGKLDLMPAIEDIQKELTSFSSSSGGNGGELSREKIMMQNLKKAFLLLAGAVAKHFGTELEEEQEIILYLSDMMADALLCEALILRTIKLKELGHDQKSVDYEKITAVFCDEAMERTAYHGRRVLDSWASGDMKRTLHLGLKRFTTYDAVNQKDLRRQLSERLVDSGKYCF